MKASSHPPAIRAFIALNLAPEIAVKLEQLQSVLKSILHPDAVRWTKPEQIHLTLRFLGNISPETVRDVRTALERACCGTAPLQLRAEGLGVFPDLRRPRVLWLGLAGDLDPLRELQRRIEHETGSWGEREDRAFEPHLTLGRFKSWSPADGPELERHLNARAQLVAASWTTHEVHLMQSVLGPQGPAYTALAQVRLEGKLG
jgi:2'-5' RNA ligase